MNEWLLLLLVVGGWIFVQTVLLPRLGVST